MISLKVNENNSIMLDSLGNLAFVTGLQAVEQNCITAMKAQLGEMVYAADKGVPTLATVWDQFDPAQFEAAARATLRAVQGVQGIRAFDVTQEGDVVTYTAVIVTDFGPTTISSVL